MCASHSDATADGFFGLSPNTPQRIFVNGTHCIGNDDETFCKWPPRSPDLTVCDFFPLGIYQKQSLPATTARKH